MVWTDPGSLSTASVARTHGGGKHTVTAAARGARQAASARSGGAGTDAAADDGSPRLRRHLHRPGQGPRREPLAKEKVSAIEPPFCSSTAATTTSSPPSPTHGEHSGSGLSQDRSWIRRVRDAKDPEYRRLTLPGSEDCHRHGEAWVHSRDDPCRVEHRDRLPIRSQRLPHLPRPFGDERAVWRHDCKERPRPRWAALKQHALGRQNVPQPCTASRLRIPRLVPRRKDQHWSLRKLLMYGVGELAYVINAHTQPRMNQPRCTTLDLNHNRGTLSQMVKGYGQQLMKKPAERISRFSVSGVRHYCRPQVACALRQIIMDSETITKSDPYDRQTV